MNKKNAINSSGCTRAAKPVQSLSVASVSLPILADHNHKGSIAHSKNGKRRAIVLACVQLLIIAHIVLWLLSKKYGWFGGRTITPIEPSESMDFSKNGVINAGLIFFSLALLSTLIFGRWFCGWGCHVVMLQDFCGWVMKKCGVRPKAFRSRFLIYVPLILAIYMFIMPAVHRWGLIPLDLKLAESLGSENWFVESHRAVWSAIGFPLPYAALPEWKVSSHLTTTDFWRTFAGVLVAFPFLFVCGFATVYFLGAKGFCTYGCPYGGFFAPLDKLAPGRILVTDACEGCGHCTAVCTSNVRVHEEVREYGMVVDPGCMKCMDCVSVCPKEALYFGFAKPAVMKGPAKSKAPKRVYDLSLGEEIAASIVFLLAFLCVRGVYGLVPMLMAGGVAGIVTFLTWKLWRVVRDQNVTLHKFQLKLKGAITRSGIVFTICVAALLLLVFHSGVVNAAYAAAGRHDARVNVPASVLFSGQPIHLTPEMSDSADRAMKLYRRASSIGEGGIGLAPTWRTHIDLRLAWLHAVKAQFAESEDILEEHLREVGSNESVHSQLGHVLRARAKNQEAAEMYIHTLRTEPTYEHLFDEFAAWAPHVGAIDDAIALARERMQRDVKNLHAKRWLSRLLLLNGSLHEGLTLVRAVIQDDPNNARDYFFLALGLADQGSLDQAIEAMTHSVKLDPHNQESQMLLNQLQQTRDANLK